MAAYDNGKFLARGLIVKSLVMYINTKMNVLPELSICNITTTH